MSKVLTFNVAIEGLEDKIWRKIEITDLRTVADLAYTILASFDSLAYHLYNIKYDGKRYDCMICSDDYYGKEELIDATNTKLKMLNLNIGDKLVMDYDYGSTTTFIITYLESKDLKRGTGNHYPYVIDGAGRGMIDDLPDFELKEIVEDIDKKGYSDYFFTPGYERKIKYDYRNYDIDLDNALLKGEVYLIKENYEMGK